MNADSTYRILFFILLIVMLIIRIYFSLRLRMSGERNMPDRQAIRQEGVILFAARVVLFFVLITILVLFAISHPWIHATNFPLPAWLRWLCFIIGLVSLAFLVFVERELGRQFSPQLQLRQEHKLVTSGPYSRIRHPLYTAIYGFGLSLAMVSANWLFVAFFLLSLVGLNLRVPKEERMMVDQFGNEYRLYMQSTGRYFPKV